jgi:5-methylcytosine-specific restriction endonuclease McrA
MLRGDDIVHLEVFERDNWICHLCTQQIDPRLRGDAWMRATIDHVIPLCRGGSHTWDNVKAAHWKCNMQKGDQLTLGIHDDIMGS